MVKWAVARSQKDANSRVKGWDFRLWAVVGQTLDIFEKKGKFRAVFRNIIQQDKAG